jgi:hypothetical protein
VRFFLLGSGTTQGKTCICLSRGESCRGARIKRCNAGKSLRKRLPRTGAGETKKPISEIRIKLLSKRVVFLLTETVTFCANAPQVRNGLFFILTIRRISRQPVSIHEYIHHQSSTRPSLKQTVTSVAWNMPSKRGRSVLILPFHGIPSVFNASADEYQ